MPSHSCYYQTCSAYETFSKCPMAIHLKPISEIRENLPMKFGFCRPSHMVFLQCVTLTHSSNIQIVNHYLIIQSNWLFHNQAMALVIKFNKNLQFYLLQKLTCSIVGFFCKQHYYAHYNFILTIITWLPTYHASLLTQSYTSQQWLVVINNSFKFEISQFKFNNPTIMHINYFHNHETLLIKFGSFYMVDSGIGQVLTS